MLVLTRKRDESIKIGNNIVIRVMKTGSGSVKLGIEAPASVRVMRGELATLEQPEMKEAAAGNDDEVVEHWMMESMLVPN